MNGCALKHYGDHLVLQNEPKIIIRQDIVRANITCKYSSSRWKIAYARGVMVISTSVNDSNHRKCQQHPPITVNIETHTNWSIIKIHLNEWVMVIHIIIAQIGCLPIPDERPQEPISEIEVFLFWTRNSVKFWGLNPI